LRSVVLDFVAGAGSLRLIGHGAGASGGKTRRCGEAHTGIDPRTLASGRATNKRYLNHEYLISQRQLAQGKSKIPIGHNVLGEVSKLDKTASIRVGISKNYLNVRRAVQITAPAPIRPGSVINVISSQISAGDGGAIKIRNGTCH
jgi:hypothetical protein